MRKFTVTGADDYSVGGFIGYRYLASIINCFWDTESSGQTTSSGGTGKSTAQMQSISTFAGWGCDPVWTINDGVDYPHLAWENMLGELITKPAYGGGSGTTENPYLIYTAGQFNAIGLVRCDLDKHFRLMVDIDLSVCTGTQFNIIGNLSTPFTGVFDGNGKVIYNFRLSHSEMGAAGMFGSVDGATAEIRDLALVDPSVKVPSAQDVGSLVGGFYRGTIGNCLVEVGNVSGHSNVGGLVGYNGSEGHISNSRSSANVSGDYCIGGLSGFNRGIIVNCYSSGSVSGKGDGGDNRIGGLVGQNAGDISNCYSTADVTGDSQLGGLAGSNRDGKISECYSSGIVTGVDLAGGLVGYNFDGQVADSFWDVNSSGKAISAGGTGKTTAEMQTRSTFTDAGWDFVGENFNGTKEVWRLCADGMDYPRLSWQFLQADFVCPDGVDMEDLDVFVKQWLLERLSADTIPRGGDGFVNFLDWTDLAESWQSTPDINELADFAEQWLQFGAYCADMFPSPDGDGRVNMLDFAVFAGSWLAGFE